MSQTRIESLIETCLNVAIGFCVSYAIWPLVAWLYGLPYSHAQNLGITTIFTVLSIARGYIVRRFFNHGLHRAAYKIARSLRRSDS